jgi:predicted nucleotidyltransferase
MTEIGLQPLVEPDSFTRRTMALPCADPGTAIRVDLIFSFSPYERRAVERAQGIRIGNCDVCLACVEDLVVHKLLAVRPRDIEDVIGIMRKNPHADLVYVRSVLKEFASAADEPLEERLDEILNLHRRWRS